MHVKIVRRSKGATRTSDDYTAWYADKIGEVFEVEYHPSQIWYTVKHRPGIERRFEKYILIQDVLEVEIPMKFPELKSGMLVKRQDNVYGVVIGRAIWYCDEGLTLTGKWDYIVDFTNGKSKFDEFVAVYKGVSEHGNAPSRRLLQETPIWPEPKMVKLNSKYTAEILDNGKVKVGCQEFELSKIEELVKLAKSK